jgi:NAD dependent epimerase/dehydratase family
LADVRLVSSRKLIAQQAEIKAGAIPDRCRAAMGRTPSIKIFGSDNPTPDGTCVRDYVHVSDLADAHVAALEWLAAGNPSESFNLGQWARLLGRRGRRDCRQGHATTGAICEVEVLSTCWWHQRVTNDGTFSLTFRTVARYGLP